jgi:amino acid adenylation domain-containing protein
VSYIDRQRTVHRIFECQAEKTPAAIALSAGGDRITYAELNTRANRLAHYLRANGVGPETLVGISIESSPDLITGMLAILKAGGAYVPLDPKYPKARLQFMLEDADTPVLLTHSHLAPLFPSYRRHIVCLDRDIEAISRESGANPEHDTGASNLVYVMYTSGSTGKPKGVCIEHRGIVRLVVGQDFIHLGPDEVIPLVTSISFDLSTFEIWGALLNGGQLVLLPAGLKALHEIGAALIANGVTTLSISTGLFHVMIDERLDDFEHVRQFLPAGEALSAPHVKKLLRRFPGARVINGYGPTENTSYTTCYMAAGPDAFGATVPIGKAIAGTLVRILDADLHPVGPGLTGELCTGGLGLARGYLNRPEIDAERFIRDPSVADPEARLYRTGDLVRELPDGNIEYLGRMDNQVKIRGFRVEIGEIEAVVRQHPAVQQGVVLLREEKPGDKRLVGYVVPNPRYGSDVPESLATDKDLVGRWQEVYDDTYAHRGSGTADEFDTSGWNSSYTGRPIPQEEMRPWVGAAVERILALRPNRVMELGCGTGLLIYPIAPHCTEYFGTDFSAQAIRQLGDAARHLPQLRLACRTADDFEGIAPESYDTVILNGVAQHFPSMDYLLTVIEGAIRILRDGGHMFIGDARSLPLLEAYQTSVALHRSPDSLHKLHLRRLVRQRMEQEEELVIDPAFYLALRKRIARIGHVQVQPRPGRHRNELTRFRFDTVIHVGPRKFEQAEPVWLDWREHDLTLERVGQLLRANRPAVLGIRSVPNARIADEVRTMAWLAESDAPHTVGEWRRALADGPANVGVEPQDLADLAENLGYSSEMSSCRSDRAGAFDFVFLSQKDGVYRLWPDVEDAHVPQPWSRYANERPIERDARRVEADIRRYLGSLLPDYMVPQAIVLLDALPLTPNGKVDTAALPPPRVETTESAPASALAQTPVEQLLSSMWCDLLGLEAVGRDQDFINLGGHSLLAVQLMNRVRETFRVELPLHALFQLPTIAGLAREIEKARESGGTQAPPARSYPRGGPLPLSLSQEGNRLRLQLAPACPFLNVPMMLHYAGRLDRAVVEQALNEIVRRHEIARTTFAIVDGNPVQVVHPSLSIAVRLVDLEHLPEHRRESEALRIATEEARLIFDLERGPLLRALLIRANKGDDRLLITLHHQICDGFSIHQALFRELVALYDAFSAGRPSPLPELRFQYADYAIWEREFLQDSVLQPHLAYWRRKLANLAPLSIPYDYPRPADPTFATERHFISFGKSLTDRLTALSKREGVTMFMSLLAAYEILLFRCSGHSEIPVMTFAAGLQREEFKDLLGIFVNFLPIAATLDEKIAYRDLLARVRQATLDAYSHHELPFPRLMKEVRPRLFAGEDRAFQAVFIYDSHLPPIDPRWTISWMEVYNGAGIRDLSLEIQERPEGLVGLIQYRSELFRPETVAGLAEEYVSLLEAVAGDAGQSISQLMNRELVKGNRIV